MRYSLDLDEAVGISDSYSAELELDAVIYRKKFEENRRIYMDTKSEHDLVFCFIFLHIYIECFLHQNMRRAVEFEFKVKGKEICMAWYEGERRIIERKLDSFVGNFFNPIPMNIQKSIESIKVRFSNLSEIRNKFIHGHKVAKWTNSNGNSGETLARSLLTVKQLNKSITEVNEIGLLWDNLLNEIIPQCKVLHRVDFLKFSKI